MQYYQVLIFLRVVMIILLMIISLISLLWAANNLVTGASGIAAHYHISPLFLGFTLVALGTSAPEIMIAITASIEGFTDLTIGNAIGTNIANIGLVLGLTALIKPIRVQSTLLRREYPLLFLVMLFSYSLMLDGYLGVLDGCLLLLICVLLLGYFILLTRQQRPQRQLTIAFQNAILKKRSIKVHFLNLILGIIVLPISAKYFVSSGLQIGHFLGISDLVLGLTLLSIGTCLPELITSIVAVIQGADDIAIGNILGANMLNLLAVMIFPSMIHPAVVSTTLLWRDIPVMFVTTFILLWINYRNKQKMARWHGGILILIYCCYLLSLIINAAI
jgi:cation:H+ antiporter